MIGHILLIDDDPDEWDIFNEALQEVCDKCKCTYADGALDGLNMLRYIRPDVIFLDINMSKVNGFECLQRIKQIDNFASVPVVIYSNGIMDETVRKANELGAIACIRKPTGIPDLAIVLDHVINSNEPLEALGNKFI
ncbi:MAG: response regulator [Chitinophagaceae bacterium]|nr:MAG: response regulator [Chitinophagaceae bacterium]